MFLATHRMKDKFKNTLVYLIAFSLLGCGTINTTIRGDSVARRNLNLNLNQVETSCRTIPRVYSGVSYDICMLRGKPSHTMLWLGSAPQLILVDLALSSVLDTIVLPYTVYGQINDGSIDLK